MYVNALLQSGKGDPKILTALKQISDLHRNPLIHPDAILSSEDALNVIGVARSVTSAMLAVLPEMQQQSDRQTRSLNHSNKSTEAA